jgi:hypothetical protein
LGKGDNSVLEGRMEGRTSRSYSADFRGLLLMMALIPLSSSWETTLGGDSLDRKFIVLYFSSNDALHCLTLLLASKMEAHGER